MEHPPYDIGDMLPVEVIEKILSSLDTHAVFVRARSVSKNWLAAIDSLIRRNKMPLRTPTERIRFAEFKFLSQYRHLLDITDDNSAKDTKSTKKTSKEEKKQKSKRKKKDKKSKKDKQATTVPAFPPKSPTIIKDIKWLRSSFEKVLSSPSDRGQSYDKEIILLRVWFFAEEEELIRQHILTLFKLSEPPKLLWFCYIQMPFSLFKKGYTLSTPRVPLLSGYFMMIGAAKFLEELEKELLKILGPYKDTPLKLDPTLFDYQPTHIDVLLDMTRDAVKAAANILNLLPSKMIYFMKLMYQSRENSAMLVLLQFFVRFVIPSVMAMFELPTKKHLLTSANVHQLHKMAIIILCGMLEVPIKEPYMERANNFSSELKILLVPSFEKLVSAERDTRQVRRSTFEIGDAIILDLEKAVKIMQGL